LLLGIVSHIISVSVNGSVLSVLLGEC